LSIRTPSCSLASVSVTLPHSSFCTGAAIAQAYGGRALAVTVGLLTAGSMLTLIVAEYLALGRLIHWLHGLPLRATLAWNGVPFVIADALSLVNPDRFYNDLLTPSRAALYVSQLLVFLVFPRFRRGALGFGLAALAIPLAGWASTACSRAAPRHDVPGVLAPANGPPPPRTKVMNCATLGATGPPRRGSCGPYRPSTRTGAPSSQAMMFSTACA
jgi:hypothetical protein